MHAAPSDPAITISYPPELPVSRMRAEIAEAVSRAQVVVVAGETGSGKTTQLPKICLELGRTTIAHTQPRRIAARAIAERIAEELGTELGGVVGYSVRFTDRSSGETRIRVMTDGILLAEIHRDRRLTRYDTIIIDEAHERSLNIDFLLGYLKRLLPERPDLKVIITSATIDVERFAAHFADADGRPAPIVEVSGRTYPVDVRYRPLVAERAPDADDDEDADPVQVAGDRDLADGVADALAELAPGDDVLVFLSGEAEIRDVTDALRGRLSDATEILPLYGRLSAADQHRVFSSRPAGVRRRVVLATNVAETSLTVPGIRAVIDGGTARISRYSARAKVQRLPIEPVSQASAAQRAGRAGRTAPGVAVRLYSESDFDRRPAFTDPEILRTNLAAVVLQMLSLGLGDIGAFPFLDPPETRGVRAAFELLTELRAVTEERGTPRITRVGRDLARLPLDPRFGRMLLESRRHGVTREVIAIVAGLTVQDPRERPVERRDAADTLHRRFDDPAGDLMGLLNLWRHIETQAGERSSSAFRRMCKAEFLAYLRVREWQDLVRQLERTAKQLELPLGDGTSTDSDAIHRSVLAGLLSQIGLLDERTAEHPGRPAERGARRRPQAEYRGARQVVFALHPGSMLARKPPAAIMSAELVETSRLFARMNARIDPAWAEPIAGDLVKRQFGEPRWDAARGSAVADERVTLFGVPIIEKRRVQFSRVNLPRARDLLIEEVLVAGNWPPGPVPAFERANRRTVADLTAKAERARTAIDLDAALFAFYDTRLPVDVATVRGLESWWKERSSAGPDPLVAAPADLLPPDEQPDADEAAFPRLWRHGDQELRLGYRFAPGTPDDGVTVRVPLPLLAGLSPVGFDWQVPGFRRELVAAMLRTLPKSIRRTVVPANDWAARFVADLPAGPEAGGGAEPLAAVLADRIRRATGAAVTAADFDAARLPPHLRIAFEVIGDRRNVLGRDVDLSALQARLADRGRAAVARVADRAPDGVVEQRDLQAFPTVVPQVLDLPSAGGIVRAYPALVDRDGRVDLVVLPNSADQAAAHRAGVSRLLVRSTPSPASYVQQHLTGAEKLALVASPYPTTAALFDDALAAIADRAVPAEPPWTATDFETIRAAFGARVVDDLFTAVGRTAAALAAARDADAAIRANEPPAPTHRAAVADARAQLDALIHPGFVRIDGADRLTRLPVYLAGLRHRMERLPQQAARDAVWQADATAATELYLAAGGTLPLTASTPPKLVATRWLLEEFRLSLFAQHLPTAQPASLARIRRSLA